MEEAMEIPFRVILFFTIWAVSYLAIKMGLSIFNNIKRKEKVREATVIYNRRKRNFDYHNDKDGWKEWKHMNDKICDLVEGSSYY